MKIDNIIVKNFSGQVSEEESSYLKTWLELSETNRCYYKHIIHILETLQKENKNEFEIPDIDGEWERLKNSIHLKQRQNNRVFLRIAAIFITILGTSLIFMYIFKPENKSERHAGLPKSLHRDTIVPEKAAAEPQAISSQKKVYYSAPGSHELLLADDSRVILDRGSKLVFDDKGPRRLAFLDGSGVFHVKHLVKKDFLLSTDKLGVHVTGTIFEIRESSSKKKVDIYVQEGEIEVFSKRDKSTRQLIRTGECYVYNVKQDKFRQKNTRKNKLKFKSLKNRFTNFFKKE